MSTVCASSEKCPIFNGILQGKDMTSKAYRKQYCENGETGWGTCKRFMTKQHFGSCPSDLLPNAALSVDQIGVKYKLSKQEPKGPSCN